MNPSNSAEAEARLRGASDKARKGSAGGARQEHTRSDGKRKFGRSSGQKQEEVGAQTAVVAAAGALTDSEWHVVFFLRCCAAMWPVAAACIILASARMRRPSQ